MRGKVPHAARRGPPIAGRFASTNRQQYRQRADDILTEAEIEEIQTRSGKGFRLFFFGLIAALIALLMWAKYDVEVNLETPQIESGVGFGEVKAPDATDANTDALHRVSTDDMEKYYGILGVHGRIRRQEGAQSVDVDKERRRENYRVRQELKKAFEKHMEERGQLVHCGRSCEAKSKQVELAYDALASQVDRELFGVLLDSKDTKAQRRAAPNELREAYESKKKLIEETESDEDRAMALEELQDAYDILINPEARTQYLLTGRKPPVWMKHTSARSGGWGIELSSGTYKFRMIWSIISHFGPTAEVVVVMGLVLLLLLRIPNIVRTTMKLKERIEEQESLDAMEYERSKEGK